MLLMVALTAIQASPGDVVDVNVTSPALLSVDDGCMYFTENLQSTIHATEGVYHLKVGLNCTPGLKEVRAGDEVVMRVEVLEANSSYIASYAADLEKKYLKLEMEVSELQKSLKDLSSKYRDAVRQKEMAAIQIELLKDQIAKLKNEIKKLKEELESRESTVSDLQKELQNTVKQSEVYRVATYFMLSLIFGTFAALVYLSRKE